MKKNYNRLLFLFSLVFIVIFSAKPSFGHNLDFDKVLKISRPLNSVVSVEADDTKYYITGICNPKVPLYMNGHEIEDTESGIFGIEVNLSSSENRFVFTQESNEETVLIYKDRSISDMKKPGPRPKHLTISPPFPAQNLITSDKIFKLSCPAPANSKVTAVIDDHEFELNLSENANIDENNEEEYIQFYGEADFSDEFDTDDEIQYRSLGPVKYIVTQDDDSYEILSDGYIIISDDEEIDTDFVEVSRARASVLEKPNIDSRCYMTLKRGCILEIDKSVEIDDWFKLKNNLGYISKSSVCPANPDSNIKNVISSTSFDVLDNGDERFTLSGTCKPAFASGLFKDKLVVRLYHTTGVEIDGEIYQDSSLIDSIDLENRTSQTELTFNFRSNSDILGYNVEYDGDDTIIILKKFPEIKNSTKPLKNVSIMLNAGHGGLDIGAFGLLGNVGGPTEKDFNLEYTLSLKKSLEASGATVYLTRENDRSVSLNNIAKMTEEIKPDVFISIHGDSIGDNMNASKISGFSLHYHTNHSKELASKIASNISDLETLNFRGVKQNDYYVTKSTISPSILIETGMLTNPSDVRHLISNSFKNDLTKAVSSAIADYFNKSED